MEVAEQANLQRNPFVENVLREAAQSNDALGFDCREKDCSAGKIYTGPESIQNH
jgi:hypothetical protein